MRGSKLQTCLEMPDSDPYLYNEYGTNSQTWFYDKSGQKLHSAI
jgi:hypothetical protein